MIIHELKIYNFRRFKSVDDAPGLQITFHKGLNALIGENDSGKTAVLIFDPEKIDKVIGEFINALETHGLYDNKGVYKAIGAAKKEDLSGLKIGSYWSEFDGSVKKQSEYSYWALVDDITTSLLDGKLYKAEHIVHKLLCRIFHYAKVRHPISGKEYYVATIKRSLDDEYRDIYRQWLYELSRLQNIERETIDCLMRQKINELLRIKKPQADDIFGCLPEYFLNRTAVVNQTE